MANQNRYYKTPFAESGNKAEVPNVSVGGAVGFDSGFGPDYELPQGSPSRKRIERDLYNGMHFGITKNIKQWQENLYPTWIEDNGTGVAFAYPQGMIVNHAGQDWVSNEDANQEEPGAGLKWSLLLRNHSLFSEFNDDDKHFISCIPRVLGDGSVSFVDDVDHDTLGFSGISKVGDFIMRISYTDTYEQVNNLSVTIDDALCQYGVFTGGSVGISYSDFTAYSQLSGLVDTTAMTFTGSGLFPDGNAVSVSYVDDILIVDHDNHAFNQDSVVVNQVYGLSFMTKFGVSQNASQVNIIPWTELSGSLIYNGSDFVIDPTKPSLISPTQTGITYEWDGTVNALKITHPLATSYTAFVQAELGGYTEYNVEVNSLSSFRVYFFNSAGTQITSPTTGMKIMFSRPGCQVRGKIPTGSKFNIRAGMTPIRSANLGNVSGNNFWVSGVMQKKV